MYIYVISQGSNATWCECNESQLARLIASGIWVGPINMYTK